MTPTPQYYLITKDEIDEIFAFLQSPPQCPFDVPEFTLEIEGDVLSRPYTSASSDVLEELWQFCLDNGVELREDLIGYRGEDGFLLLKILKKIVELRQQTKEHP